MAFDFEFDGESTFDPPDFPAAALAGVAPLAAAVDGVPLEGLAAAEDGDDVAGLLRRAGWRPGLDEFANDVEFS